MRDERRRHDVSDLRPIVFLPKHTFIQYVRADFEHAARSCLMSMMLSADGEILITIRYYNLNSSTGALSALRGEIHLRRLPD